MLTIKISTASNFPLLRQLPNSYISGSSINFVLNEPVDVCDLWIVYDKLIQEESCLCNPENVILFTGEPPTVS